MLIWPFQTQLFQSDLSPSLFSSLSLSPSLLLSFCGNHNNQVLSERSITKNSMIHTSHNMIIYKVYFRQCSFFTEIGLRLWKFLKLEVKIKDKKYIGVSKKSNGDDTLEHKQPVLILNLLFITIRVWYIVYPQTKLWWRLILEKIFLNVIKSFYWN